MERKREKIKGERRNKFNDSRKLEKNIRTANDSHS